MQNSRLNLVLGGKNSNWLAGGTQNLMHIVGDGSLASRSSDTNQAKVTSWMSVVSGKKFDFGTR